VLESVKKEIWRKLDQGDLGATVRVARIVHHGMARFAAALSEPHFEELVRCV
jgi:hypothetical protein